MGFIAALPHLCTLQWWDIASTEDEHRLRHMSPACIAREAACPGGAGLRLLHADNCSLHSVVALPGSLQVLSLLSGDGKADILRERMDMLLAPCASLRELYILQSFLDSGAPLGLPALAASCPMLRVLVLHVFTATEPGVSCPCIAEGSV